MRTRLRKKKKKAHQATETKSRCGRKEKIIEGEITEKTPQGKGV